MVIFLYTLYIFICINHSCLANMDDSFYFGSKQ